MPSLSVSLPSLSLLVLVQKRKMDGQLRPDRTTDRLFCDTHVAGVSDANSSLNKYLQCNQCPMIQTITMLSTP